MKTEDNCWIYRGESVNQCWAFMLAATVRKCWRGWGCWLPESFSVYLLHVYRLQNCLWRLMQMCVYVWEHVHAKLLQWCPTLCNPMDRSPSGSSVHWILQARVLEWVAMPSSRGSSQPRDQTCVSYVSGTSRRVLYHHNFYHLLNFS